MPPPNVVQTPGYQLALTQGNALVNEALRTQLARQSQLFLQLGSPSFARATFLNNTFTAPGRWRRVQNDAGAWVRRRGPRRQITPYERAQLAAIRQAGKPKTGTSQLAQIGYQYGQQKQQLNEEMLNANLFYSGARAKQLGELARGRQFQTADVFNQARQQMFGLQDPVIAARQARREQLFQAALQAYNILEARQIAG